MGALSLLRAMCSAAPASGSHSPDLPCDPLLKRGELFHPRNTRALCRQRLARQAGDVRRPPRTTPELPERCKNRTSSC